MHARTRKPKTNHHQTHLHCQLRKRNRNTFNHGNPKSQTTHLHPKPSTPSQNHAGNILNLQTKSHSALYHHQTQQTIKPKPPPTQNHLAPNTHKDAHNRGQTIKSISNHTPSQNSQIINTQKLLCNKPLQNLILYQPSISTKHHGTPNKNNTQTHYKVTTPQTQTGTYPALRNTKTQITHPHNNLIQNPKTQKPGQLTPLTRKQSHSVLYSHEAPNQQIKTLPATYTLKGIQSR